MRRSAKVDANHGSIVDYLRQAGCKVHSTAPLGGGFPDLVVFWRRTGRLRLVEVKDGSLPASRRRLTEDEHKFHVEWAGAVSIIETVAQAMALVKELDRA